MKTKSLVFLLFILVFACISSAAPIRAYGQSGSSVWKISKDGNTIFLGGSVHILRDEDFPLPEEFDRAFNQSSMVILEANVEELSDQSAVQYLMERMMLPPGTTLQSVLDSETWELLKAKCGEYEISLESISRLKPSMIITILTVAEIAKFGFIQQGVDSYYFEKAKEAEKPLDFLETVEEQINLIVTMGEGYENDFVKYSLHDLDASVKELLSIVSGWKKGEATYTESELTVMKETWPMLYKTLLVDRNTAWLPRLEAYLTTVPVEFVIVGLAHLYGPDGLLHLLENSGCTVEQVK